MKTVSEREGQLRDRLGELESKLLEIEGELDEQPNKDVEERAVERESDEVLEGIGNAGLQEIHMIKAALERIAEGEYGFCVKCGEEILQERLDVVPHAPLCRNCAT